MVTWKGETGEEEGTKAQNLERLDDLNVPNFFVIKPGEIERLFGGKDDPREIMNSTLNQSIKREIKDAYEEVGMASEVREASGRAKSLVGGQRNNQHVSIRVSSNEREKYAYKLNVGSSNFFESLKEVVSSYCGGNEDFPAVIVQKMVEPGYSGVLEQAGPQTLVETVKGLGISLEEGLTKPHIHFLENNRVQNVSLAEKQLEISRNPVRGGNRRKEVEETESPFDKDEVESLQKKISRKGLNVKFVYKRGSFHIVDAYEQENRERFAISTEGLRASKGEINGRIGENIEFTDQTMRPEEYQDAIIARKGGYTSRDGYRARKAGKPALFRFSGDLEEGMSIELGPEEVEIERSESYTTQSSSRHEYRRNKDENNSKESVNPFKDEKERESEQLTGSEVLPLDPRVGKGVFLNRSSDRGYVVTDRRTEANKVPQRGYINSYRDVVVFNDDKAALDIRNMDAEGAKAALGKIEAELKILVAEDPSKEVVEKAVSSGFRVFSASEDNIDSLERKVAEAEKRYILDRLQELD